MFRGRRRRDGTGASDAADIVERALRSPALAESWRPWLEERLAGAGR
jgi:hypothetical protein